MATVDEIVCSILSFQKPQKVHMATKNRSHAYSLRICAPPTMLFTFNGSHACSGRIYMQHYIIAKAKKGSHAYSGRIYMQHITIREDKKSSHAYS